MKKCKFCQEEIDEKATRCPKCGGNLKDNRKTLLIILGVVVVIIILCAVFGSSNNSDENSSNSSTSNNSSQTNTDNNSSNNSNTTNSNSNTTNSGSSTGYTLGDTITFDELEITFGTEYTFVTLSNKYSDLDGSSVIKLPVNVKNVSDEKNHLNMYYYDCFGSKGTELDSVSAYFSDDVIDYAGDLKSGASYDTYFYILYDGDGTYSIDFDNWSEEVSVEFEITKSN